MNIQGYEEGEIVRNSCYGFNAFWHQTDDAACWGLYLDQYPDMSLSTSQIAGYMWIPQFRMKPMFEFSSMRSWENALAFSD